MYRCELRPGNITIALKELTINDPQELKMLKNELMILRNCKNPNLVECYGFNTTSNRIQIALEYMDFGKLNYLIQIENALPEPIISLIAAQMLRGLHCLHKDHKIIHRDLKPSNVLLNTKGEVKISDFGISRQVTGTEGVANTYVGTKLYMSPERLVKDQYYQTSSDIWALGLIVYECALGKFPCHDQIVKMGLIEDELRDFYLKGNLLEFPKTFSEDLKDFLRKCLKVSPAERAKASELLEHPFIEKSKNLPDDSFKKWLDFVIKKKLTTK